jgi:hypothetical protein
MSGGGGIFRRESRGVPIRELNTVITIKIMEKTMEINIEYDGAYPNLCRGNLVVIIDGKKWQFPDYCLSSGGYVTFDENWTERIGCGPWGVREWPKDFPDNLKSITLTAINGHIPWGCCGGCV